MRDAMSLLDQVIAFGSARITAEDVAKVLGVADREVLGRLTGAVLGGDAAGALEVLDAVSRQGFDLVHLCRDLLRHIRNIIVAKVCSEAQAKELLDLADEEVADVLALAKKHEVDDLTRLFSGLSKGFDEIVKSGQVRSALEITLVRLARRPALLPLDELLVRLGDLEKRLASGAPPPPRGGGSAGSGSGSGSGSRGREPTAHAGSASAPASASASASAPASASASASASAFAPSFAAPRLAQTRATPVPAITGALALAEIPETAAPQEVTPLPSSAIVESSAPIDAWRAILARIKPVRPAIAATLELAAPNVVTKERIVLGFEPESFEDGRASESDAREVLVEHAKAYFGGIAPSVIFEVARGTKGASVASLDAAKKKAAIAEARAAVEKHPLVQKAIALFDAELREIRLPAQED
jgi:DNA polymerase-3 subunit gamma/tau